MVWSLASYSSIAFLNNYISVPSQFNTDNFLHLN